LLFELVLRFK